MFLLVLIFYKESQQNNVMPDGSIEMIRQTRTNRSFGKRKNLFITF